MATSPINKTQPMREAEQDIADYLNETVALYMVQETQERKDADTKLTSDLASEVSRAEAAEQKLTSDLASEVSRAEAAEQKLTSDLASEVTNRENAFTSLKGDLNSETSARSDADSLLQGNIDLVNDKFPIKTDNIGAAQVTKAKLHESLQQQMTFLETVPSMEFGYINLGTIGAGTTITHKLTFSETKTEAPFAFCTPVVNSDAVGLTARVKYTTTTDAMFIINNGGTTSVSNATLDYLIISGR